MKAMILAAGLGKRMRPLTENCPKPLLTVSDPHSSRLIDFHLLALQRAGIQEVAINTHWCAEKIPEALGSGETWNMRLQYSHEPVLLETAGGIKQALPLLNLAEDEYFLVINGDIYTELDLKDWLSSASQVIGDADALLNLVPNPEHHPEGDFVYDANSNQLFTTDDKPNLPTLTYSGIALFRPAFFANIATKIAPLAPSLRQAMSKGKVKGMLCGAYWSDIGTPERLQALSDRLGN